MTRAVPLTYSSDTGVRPASKSLARMIVAMAIVSLSAFALGRQVSSGMYHRPDCNDQLDGKISIKDQITTSAREVDGIEQICRYAPLMLFAPALILLRRHRHTGSRLPRSFRMLVMFVVGITAINALLPWNHWYSLCTIRISSTAF